ncbi:MULTISPECIES: hypothetical protein [Herbaspirillum]|uniref:hypothetical protein n=1 Tax=Herbaspirillum TaxID=963 RepID=UPI0006789D75|nr:MULTISPECIES: hypothetical protein [Herbaspirillum]
MKLKQIIIVGALSVSLAPPVYAKEIASEPLPQFTMTDAEALFENDTKSMQLAALSPQEMKETEGAWVNFAVGGAIGFGSYALANYVTNRPITWQGSLYSIGTGALTGGMGGALIRASGGGLAGQIAWRPNILASNFGASQYSRYRGW